MNYKYLVLIVFLVLISGCSRSQIVDEIIETEQSHSGLNTSEIDRIVNKHIPVGMKLENALNKLDEQGFEISEHSVTGYKDYPNGELKAYADSYALARVKQRLGDTRLEYHAERFQIAQLLSSAVHVTIKSDGERVLNVSAYINAY